jgi:hypothetical protein
MVMHHSLTNNLWDRKRSLLKISNEVAAHEFANILLHGVATGNRRPAEAARTKSRSGQSEAAGKPANGRRNGLTMNTISRNTIKQNSKRKRSGK